jgi:hypothetical protein
MQRITDLMQRQFANDNTTFMRLDITTDTLPGADLWLCRDCFIHLSEADVLRAIERYLASDIPYLLASTHPQCRHNRDITTGACRLLNLEAAPFNFPAARVYLADWVEDYPERYLGLWERSALRTALTANRLLRPTAAAG